ncbi:class I SAM-dependent methyltransferase [Halorubrum sp. CSM-61]|uniref:class I SAM-dependent DNA methyltransferase n=1 Tax=Halorubrum sp. CSM-61 TaxID=2485838 RepID=UPI000F4D0CD6|nr:class I SAM-dependent methyltransferase [Halorubrum sp. CSM-61]
MLSVTQKINRIRELYQKGGVGEVSSGIRRFIAYRKYVVATWWIFRTSDDNTEAYRRLMKYRIENFGPDESVGGFEDDIGQLQFDFLKRQGLSPSDTLLDLGCGVLRGGRFYIPYLEQGNYIGMDISPDAIEEGKKIVGHEIEKKQPQFYVNDDLKFADVAEEADYIIAQSVFSHLPKEDIRECFTHLHRVLDTDGVFYATFSDEEDDRDKNFAYPNGELIDLAEDCGLNATLLTLEEYPHPYGQRMLEISLQN